MSDLLKGVALITGAGSGIWNGVLWFKYDAELNYLGIGQATALAFAQHGISKFALLDIDENGLIKTKGLLVKSRSDIDVMTVQLDLSEESGVVEAVQNVVKRFGEINIAINNAGIGGSMTRTSELELEPFRRVLEVNLIGMWIAQREVLKQMLKQPARSNR
jgi:NAD(P)-dependent dehydrogenase (short-subunit alcohol dehydrogenase family)